MSAWHAVSVVARVSFNSVCGSVVGVHVSTGHATYLCFQTYHSNLLLYPDAGN